MAPNPIQALGWLLARLKDEGTGKVLIPGFYERVRPVPEEEKALWPSLDEEALKRELGVEVLPGRRATPPWNGFGPGPPWTRTASGAATRERAPRR